ncbi:F-box only protein 22 isoform X2 [Anabrus simplex]|uniref:F-box only protein 22 isoform X2 n=1 Tax=Anabrus simplex TaxID=316456 RepID=UPI0035A3757B
MDLGCRTTTPSQKASASGQNDGAKQGEDDNVDQGSLLMNYITKEYELLKNVLKQLPAKDLKAASQVCRAWRSAATIINQSRIGPHWFLWHQSIGDFGMDELPSKLFTSHVYSEPLLCLCFMTDKTCRMNIDCSSSKVPCPCGHLRRCTLSHRVVHYLRAQLSPSCPCVLAEGIGIVGTTHDLSQTMEIESKKFGYSGLLLPKIPGVVVTMFHFEKVTSLRSLFANLQEMEELTGIPPASRPIRCLLLFSKQGQGDVLGHIVSVLQTRQEEKIAVGGGIFKSLNLCNMENQVYRLRGTVLVGIVFSGENVTAASTVLTSDIVDKEQVDEAMQELKACALPTKSSLGFMFSCLGRGSIWYNEENVESASFRSYFPHTPLLGYFGNGEIGNKHLPVLDSGEKEGNGKSLAQTAHHRCFIPTLR